MRTSQFPLYRFHEIEKRPHDFRLLERVPFSSILGTPRIALPLCLNPIAGDEVTLAIVDTETTGLDASADEIIEIGIVRCSYSPSHGVITSIDDIYSGLEAPAKGPISDTITSITGITNADVEGRTFNDERVNELLTENDPLVIAHNAKFDRPFVENRFKDVANCRWACSIKEIDWKARGFESNKLEYLLLNSGYFYDGHRATSDCLALLWLLAEHPAALDDMLAASGQTTYIVRLFDVPLEARTCLKKAGFRLDEKNTEHAESWWILASEAELEELREWMDGLTGYNVERAEYTPLTARERYKQ